MENLVLGNGRMNFNISKNYYPNLNIAKVEEKYNAKYIGDFSVKNKNNNWSDSPLSVFYVENPDIEKGHSNYFGILYDLYSDRVLITNASNVFEEPMIGIVADDGEVVISCFRHDYRESTDGSVMIDGGKSGYLRYRGNPDRLVKVGINKNELYIIKNSNEETNSNTNIN